MERDKVDEIVSRCKATDKRMEEVRLRVIEEGLCSLHVVWFRMTAVLIKRDLDAIESILSEEERQSKKVTPNVPHSDSYHDMRRMLIGKGEQK